ncbi:hypothetical protein DV735_g5148, partial [Chaetothyriales sp. CBS 134920]
MASRKRFSRDGFKQLPHTQAEETATSPRDVTIDIPLAPVTSRTGIRKTNTGSPVMTRQLSGHSRDDSNDDEYEEKRQASDPLTQSHLGGRRRRLGEGAGPNKDQADGTLNSAGRIYQKIYNFSVITRYIVFVAPLALLIAVPMVIGATIAPNARIGGVKLLWFFTWIEVVWVSLWVSKLVAKLLPYIFQFLCGVINPGTRKYAAVLTNLEIPLSLVGWALTSLTTFAVVMTQNPDARARNDTSLNSWQTVVKNILFATLCSTLVLLAEKFLIQLISISYHRKQFDDKIRQSKHNIYLISLLYDASRKLFPPYCPEFAADDYIISNSIDLHASSRSATPFGHKRSGSATPMRIIQGVGRVKDNVASAFGHVAQEVTGKKVFNPNDAHSVVVQALEKKHSSEALARRIWLSLVLEGRYALYRDDIQDVLGPDHEQDAEEAFDTLDADGNGDISLDELTLRLIEFGRDRLSVTHSVRDLDQAIHILDSVLLAIVFILVVFIFVAFLNRSFATTLATAGTALLSLSFVFSVSAQEVLGSCIFLFVKHPFDVGDRVDIKDIQYTVERISLLYTMFKSVQQNKRTQVPNIVLNTLWIDNVSRSKAMREVISIYVSFDTTMEDLELLKNEMDAFVKENSRDFQPGIEVDLTGIAEMDKLELKVEIKHKSNWANETVRATRRSKFMCALVLALRKIPLYAPGAGTPPAGDKANPSYTVAISDSEAKSNAKEYDLDKAKKRMDYDPSNDSSPPESSAAKPLGQANTDTKDGHVQTQLAASSSRSSNIEQVRGMLRRETTTGRRRRAGTGDSQAKPYLAPSMIPTIPDMSPAVPVQSSQQQAPRTSYFQENYVLPNPQPVTMSLDPTPGDHITSASHHAPNTNTNVTSASFPAPPTKVEDLPGHALTRADSATIPPSAQMQAQSPTTTNPFYQAAPQVHAVNQYPVGRKDSWSEEEADSSHGKDGRGAH